MRDVLDADRGVPDQMSSGNGKIERAVLDSLERADGWLDAYQLAALAYGITPAADSWYVTPSQVVCVKRAIASLKRKGAPITIAAFENQRAMWIHQSAADRLFGPPKKKTTPKVSITTVRQLQIGDRK